MTEIIEEAFKQDSYDEDALLALPKSGVPKKGTVRNPTGKRTIKRGMTLAKQQRVAAFIREYTNNGGKITEAAMKVFKLTDRVRAQQIGSTYLKSAKNLPELTRVLLEEKGYGFGQFLDVAIAKMEASKGTEWWDRLLKMSEYADFISKPKENSPAVNVTVFQTHKNLTSEYIEDAEPVQEEEQK